jgi:ABC-type glycerol-3-phosphate transport system permease component
MTIDAPTRLKLASQQPARPTRPHRSVAPVALTHAALIAISVALVVPFFYVIAASLKDSGSLFAYPPKWLPLPPFWGNYRRLLFDTGFLRWMANTLIVATSVTAIKLLIDSMAGYALARLQFRGRRAVFLSLLALMMVPSAAVLIPLWIIVNNLSLTDTYFALILPPLANPLGPFLIRQFILALPDDLDNAARLEGLSEFGIYRRIVMPLIKPGLVVLAVVLFTDQTMSFIWPLIATSSDDMQVLTVGVASLRAKGGVNYGLWSASAVMSMLPLGVFFFVLQRQFMARGLSGALK